MIRITNSPYVSTSREVFVYDTHMCVTRHMCAALCSWLFDDLVNCSVVACTYSNSCKCQLIWDFAYITMYLFLCTVHTALCRTRTAEVPIPKWIGSLSVSQLSSTLLVLLVFSNDT